MSRPELERGWDLKCCTGGLPSVLLTHVFPCRQLFSETDAGTGERQLCKDGFCAILRLLLGTPAADGAELHSRLCRDDSRAGLTLGESPQAAAVKWGMEGKGNGSPGGIRKGLAMGVGWKKEVGLLPANSTFQRAFGKYGKEVGTVGSEMEFEG